MTGPTIGFAGLTHLGVVSAAAAAAAGASVVGWDPDPATVQSIAAGRLPVTEPGLEDVIRNHRGRLQWSETPAALDRCEIVYIAADVPTDGAGAADLGGISTLIDAAIGAMPEGRTLVILSQVPPGFTRTVAFPRERLFCQVETLVFGRAVERATKPERIIVGQYDPRLPLPAPYEGFLRSFNCPILRVRYESAELAKIAINCYLAASVTVSNTLAELSEQIGADWSEIVPALRLDRRIGPDAYVVPGLGLSGGNIERDLAAVLRLAAAAGTEAAPIRAMLRSSDRRRDWALRTLHAAVLETRPDAVIGILGLAYKENTRSTKNSPALALLEHLTPWQVRVYDPAVSAAELTHPRLVAAPSALAAASDADAVCIMTPWPEFRDLSPAALAGVMKGRVFLDPFRVLDGAGVDAAGLEYFTLGRPPLRNGGGNA
jgi:UDPglucose 6-dehydrogenase